MQIQVTALSLRSVLGFRVTLLFLLPRRRHLADGDFLYKCTFTPQKGELLLTTSPQLLLCLLFLRMIGSE